MKAYGCFINFSRSLETKLYNNKHFDAYIFVQTVLDHLKKILWAYIL